MHGIAELKLRDACSAATVWGAETANHYQETLRTRRDRLTPPPSRSVSMLAQSPLADEHNSSNVLCWVQRPCMAGAEPSASQPWHQPQQSRSRGKVGLRSPMLHCALTAARSISWLQGERDCHMPTHARGTRRCHQWTARQQHHRQHLQQDRDGARCCRTQCY